MPGIDQLTEAQRTLLDSWFGKWDVVCDHSWPLQDTTVLQLRTHEGDLIVKASRSSHHIDREIAAHRTFLASSTATIPRLVHSDVNAKTLVTRYLPGELVEGTAAEWEPSTYRKAGQALDALLIPGEVSQDYLAELRDRGLQTIDRATELVDPGRLGELRKRWNRIIAHPIALAFTHGDYHPRNWLLHAGELAVIDFGRAQIRHWTSDLVRLQFQQFVGRPDLEAAFLEGLDRRFDELDAEVLEYERIYQAISTVVWAHGIDDTPFEEHGRRMIDTILAEPRAR